MQALDVMQLIVINPPSLPMPHIRRTPSMTVAFVNNTSDRALAATEAQFLALLQSAAAGIDLQVRFYTCPNIVRAATPRTNLGRAYADMTSLFDTHIDALVVTGMEPTTPELRDEPVWQPLTQLIDWVDHKGIPSIWSCLAAHAAVLRLNGVERTRQPSKVSDILCCEAVAETHPLISGLPRQWWIPHSRYYGLPEAALTANGYQVLSRTEAAGVDVFMRKGRSSFIFFQGHPEYDHDSLLKEYKRDLRRYFCGTRDEFPVAPESYFGKETTLNLAQMRQQALQSPRHARADGKMLDQILAIASTGVAPVRWNHVATGICANWMTSFGPGTGRGQASARPPAEMTVGARSMSTPEPMYSK